MSELKTQGTVAEILKEVSGTSKAGKEWKKQEFIIETNDKFSKSIAFTVFGDKTDLLMNIKAGDFVEVLFNVESRAWEGRWFSNINAYRITLINAKEQAPQETANDVAKAHNEQYNKVTDVKENESGDLPF